MFQIYKLYSKNTNEDTDALEAIFFKDEWDTTDVRHYACQLYSESRYARITAYTWYGKQVKNFTCKGDHQGHRIKKLSKLDMPNQEERTLLEGLPNHDWIFLSLSEMKEAQQAGKSIRKIPSERWLAAQDPDLTSLIKLSDGRTIEVPIQWSETNSLRVIRPQGPFGRFDPIVQFSRY